MSLCEVLVHFHKGGRHSSHERGRHFSKTKQTTVANDQSCHIQQPFLFQTFLGSTSQSITVMEIFTCLKVASESELFHNHETSHTQMWGTSFGVYSIGNIGKWHYRWNTLITAYSSSFTQPSNKKKSKHFSKQKNNFCIFKATRSCTLITAVVTLVSLEGLQFLCPPPPTHTQTIQVYIR